MLLEEGEHIVISLHIYLELYVGHLHRHKGFFMSWELEEYLQEYGLFSQTNMTIKGRCHQPKSPPTKSPKDIDKWIHDFWCHHWIPNIINILTWLWMLSLSLSNHNCLA